VPVLRLVLHPCHENAEFGLEVLEIHARTPLCSGALRYPTISIGVLSVPEKLLDGWLPVNPGRKASI
jgi:hypothetical protein